MQSSPRRREKPRFHSGGIPRLALISALLLASLTAARVNTHFLHRLQGRYDAENCRAAFPCSTGFLANRKHIGFTAMGNIPTESLLRASATSTSITHDRSHVVWDTGFPVGLS